MQTLPLPLKFRVPLGWKLIVSISALIVLTSITLGWFAGQYAVELIKSGLLERGRSLARNLAGNSEYGVLIGNHEILSQLVNGTIKEEDVLYAVILNEEGEGLAGARSAQLPVLPPKNVERRELDEVNWTDPATKAYQVHWSGEIFYEVTFPVRTQQVRRSREEIGLALDETPAAFHERSIGLAAVGMSLSQQRVNAAIIKILRNIALLTALVIVAGIGVTIVLVKLIAGPVNQLASATKLIAEGNLSSHVAIKSRDEIGQLADSFNRMAEAVRQRENELRGHAAVLDRLNRQLLIQQAELQQINAQLAAASRHKSQFLANMSHELRTPLNAIIGFSGILLNPSLGKVSEEEQREFLDNIMISGKHLLGLINEVLDLSKIEAGRVTLSRDRFSVPEVVESVRQTVEPLAHKKNIVIEATFDANLPPMTADETKFRQILYNLLSNAIKFTPEAGRVRVHAQADHQSIEISVSDTGIGIKPEDRERIFHEFEQVEMSAERRFEGTGLGLTLAKKLVEIQGGRIWLESAVGKGSTFSFALPSAPETAPGTA